MSIQIQCHQYNKRRIHTLVCAHTHWVLDIYICISLFIYMYINMGMISHKGQLRREYYLGSHVSARIVAFTFRFRGDDNSFRPPPEKRARTMFARSFTSRNPRGIQHIMSGAATIQRRWRDCTIAGPGSGSLFVRRDGHRSISDTCRAYHSPLVPK